MISLSINITSTTLTLQNISGNDITLTVGLTTNELSLSVDRGVSLETVKADPDIKNAIDKAHAQNTDTILDEGGDNEVTAAQSKAGYTHSQITEGNPHGTAKEDIDGLKKLDSPEFADLTVPALNSISEGGDISDEQVEWINADAKSAKSFIQKILGYIYSIKDVVVFATPRTGVTLTGSILLDRSYTKYISKTLTADLTLSVASNPVDGGNAYIEVIGDGVHDVTYNGITLYPTSAPFDIAINKVNRGALMYEGAMAYIAWTQMN